MPMGILFAISILSFCTLLWAAISIARHVRTSATRPATTLSDDRPAPRKPPAVDRHVLPAATTTRPQDPISFRESA